MSGIVDLPTLLAQMTPALRDGLFVFASVTEGAPGDYLHLDPICFFREDEGLTLVVEASVAQAHGIAASAPMRCITLNVHSSLEAVGLTAAVAGELTRHGISANVIAAFYHDHIFVADRDAGRAVAVLSAMGK